MVAPALASADETEVVSSPPKRPYVVEAAGCVGFGTAPIRGGVSPFGAGFGARAGVEVWRLYLGLSFMDYLGGNEDGATDHAILLGVEVGYDAHFGRFFTLRPQLGIGDTWLVHTEPAAAGADVVSSASAPSSGAGPVTTTVRNLYVSPGLTAIVAYSYLFGALSGSVLVLPGITYGPAPAASTTWLSYGGELDAGVRF